MLHRKTSTKILLGAAPAFLLFALAWATMAFAFTRDDAAAALLSAMLWFCLAAYIGGLVARVCARTIEPRHVTVVFGDGTPMLDVVAQVREELSSVAIVIDDMHDILRQVRNSPTIYFPEDEQDDDEPSNAPVPRALYDELLSELRAGNARERATSIALREEQIKARQRGNSAGIDVEASAPQDADVDLLPQAERHEGAGGG